MRVVRVRLGHPVLTIKNKTKSLNMPLWENLKVGLHQPGISTWPKDESWTEDGIPGIRTNFGKEAVTHFGAAGMRRTERQEVLKQRLGMGDPSVVEEPFQVLKLFTIESKSIAAFIFPKQFCDYYVVRKKVASEAKYDGGRFPCIDVLSNILKY